MQFYKFMVAIMIIVALHTAFTELDIWGQGQGGTATYNLTQLNETMPGLDPPESDANLLLYGVQMLVQGGSIAAKSMFNAVTLYPILIGDAGIPADLVPYIVFPIWVVYGIGIAQLLLRFKVED